MDIPDPTLQGSHCLQVMEVQSDVRLCTVTEGLTEDAVSARLVQGASCLYMRPTQLAADLLNSA